MLGRDLASVQAGASLRCRCLWASVLLSWDRKMDEWTQPCWIASQAVLGEVFFLAVRMAVDGAPAELCSVTITKQQGFWLGRRHGPQGLIN